MILLIEMLETYQIKLNSVTDSLTTSIIATLEHWALRSLLISALNQMKVGKRNVSNEIFQSSLNDASSQSWPFQSFAENYFSLQHEIQVQLAIISTNREEDICKFHEVGLWWLIQFNYFLCCHRGGQRGGRGSWPLIWEMWPIQLMGNGDIWMCTFILQPCGLPMRIPFQRTQSFLCAAELKYCRWIFLQEM